MAKILTKNCLVCSKLFEKPYSTSLRNWENRSKFCSVVCKNNAPRSEATRLKMRLQKVGKPSWNKGIPHTEAHKTALRKKKPMSEEGKQAHRDSFRIGTRRVWNKIGDGITPINQRIRKSPEYKEWRRKVFERDSYTCVLCEVKGGWNKLTREKVELNADHIETFAHNPVLRFEVSNGRTLCVSCHRKTDTYGINQHTKH